VDDRKRLLCVAAINTHDYAERAPALVEADVDALAIDASDGHSVYQAEALRWLAGRYPGLPVIGGNVITGAGFRYLAEAGANAVKVGMGGGSICITQEQKGTGRGLATAVMDVAAARDAYLADTGRYLPVIADGGIVTSKDAIIALALGADCVMLGRWFARMEESPTEKVTVNGRVMKPYWGEGSARAQDWRSVRYHQGKFVEGVEGFVDYAGKLADNLDPFLAKLRASCSSCGAATLDELRREAVLELVSPLSIREGMVHDIFMPGDGSTTSTCA
jgi:IMP dehydrogenase